jgi:hypothetical protein
VNAIISLYCSNFQWLLTTFGINSKLVDMLFKSLHKLTLPFCLPTYFGPPHRTPGACSSPSVPVPGWISTSILPSSPYLSAAYSGGLPSTSDGVSSIIQSWWDGHLYPCLSLPQTVISLMTRTTIGMHCVLGLTWRWEVSGCINKHSLSLYERLCA